MLASFYRNLILNFWYAKANVSTKDTTTIESSWLPCTHEDCHRKERFEASTRTGTQKPNRLRAIGSIGFMLPQEYRLRHEKDVKTLFAKGKSVFGTLVGMKIRPNKLLVSRFAVVVGVKTAKSAVDRNRIKRRVRAIVHAHIAQMKGGWDVGLLPRKEALTAKHQELESQILNSLKKARLL